MIEDRLRELESRISEVNFDNRDITKVIVTKFRTPEQINIVIDSGYSNIAENRVQHLLEKLPHIYPEKIHLIGHLQTNKAKDAVRVCDLIQSVDSERLLLEIEKHASLLNKIQDVLIQVNIACEETKFGIQKEELNALISTASQLPHVKVKGLMAIMPKEKKDIYYQNMYDLFSQTKNIKRTNVDMDILSMGMSNDFEVAIANGSNMIRVGTFIFS